jgi:hypothetical protein
MKSVKKSDFAGLANYLADEQEKNERVGYVSFSNCEAQTLNGVIAEVVATQGCNKRAESDKTYHLIVSFRAQERPESAVLEAIEARICEGLGYRDHQRLSVVHHDTDNLHIHIAINKIHLTRYTIHDPYGDHRTLGELGEKLEREYGLEPDNHQAQKRGSENLAGDMEHHSGVESLLSWVKRECLGQLQEAESWAKIHQVMHENGLEIRERGNGLVFTDKAGTMVKASSVGREFSKGKMEARFGPFEPSPGRLANQIEKPARQYEGRPVRTRVDTVELYAQYKSEQQAFGTTRAAEWAQSRDRKTQQIEAAKRTGRLKRAAIKLMTGPGVNKKALYSLASKALKREIERINNQHLKERQTLNDKYQRQAWADWLRSKATEGNQEALAALRARGVAKALKGDTLTARGTRSAQEVQHRQDSITKKGTIIYQVGASAIRDDGDNLKVSRGTTHDGLEAALRMAMERYGNRITVNGSATFKEQVARVAASAKLPIVFTDTTIEKRRQALLNKSTAKENNNDAAARNDRGRQDRGRTGGLGSITIGGPSRGLPGPAQSNRSRFAGKPDVGRIGRNPPPESQNRLRNLSQLGLVHIDNGGEVLLPGHVPGHMEHQGANPDNGLRREVSRPGVAVPSIAAMDKYIAEREEKRLKGFDIPKHRRYNDNDSGISAFAGIRQVEGAALALLRRGEEVVVLPINEATVQRMKRLALGDPVTVTPQGSIKTKGRSR